MKQSNNLTILSIETSSDETAVAIIESQNNQGAHFNILANLVSSQIEVHKKYGGIYPSAAKREHQKNLLPVLIKALAEAKMLQKIPTLGHPRPSKSQALKRLKEILGREIDLLKPTEKFLKTYQKPKLDALAVTVGPGLEPCLWVGINFAKALAFFWDLPVIPINHLEAHILVNLVDENFQFPIFNFQTEIFPAIALVVSGGHSQLILMKKIGQYQILGETRDDAAGECFDKTGRILGLDYPGGPALAYLAKQGRESRSPNTKFQIKLPRPMFYSKNYDFSFSGLKTAVLYDFKKRSTHQKKSKQYLQALAQEIQQAIIDVLIKKTIQAGRDYQVKTIILGGGVAANDQLRKQLQESCKLKIENCRFLAAPKIYCTDNAVMIGMTAFYHFKEKKNWQEIEARPNLQVTNEPLNDPRDR